MELSDGETPPARNGRKPPPGEPNLPPVLTEFYEKNPLSIPVGNPFALWSEQFQEKQLREDFVKLSEEQRSEVVNYYNAHLPMVLDKIEREKQKAEGLPTPPPPTAATSELPPGEDFDDYKFPDSSVDIVGSSTSSRSSVRSSSTGLPSLYNVHHSAGSAAHPEAAYVSHASQESERQPTGEVKLQTLKDFGDNIEKTIRPVMCEK